MATTDARTALHELVDKELSDAGQPNLATIVANERKGDAPTPWGEIVVMIHRHTGRRLTMPTLQGWFPQYVTKRQTTK